MAKPNIIWKPFKGSQTQFLSCPAWECLLHGNRGGGKGLLPTEKILTPRGWSTLEKLKLGSVISNPDGTSQTVTQIFYRDKQQMYKIRFADGTNINCDGDHLWFSKISNRIKGKTVRNYAPFYGYGSIFRTEDLYKLLKKHPHKTPLIPCNDPIVYQQNWKYEVDAYLIGLILGDVRENHEISLQVNKLELRGTKFNSKFIPERLMRGSIEERLALLQGLMDSDGYVSEDGKCGYGTVSKQLAKDVRHLILSLGGLATINTKNPHYTYKGEYKEGQLRYSLYIQFPNKEDLFRLTRKKERAKDSDYVHGRLVRKMQSIQKLPEKKKTICIVVSNPNRLFVTKEFLVTHNTDVLIMDYLQGVGRGYGADYKGLLLREATTELGDIISKTRKWIPQMFPTARYNASKKVWSFPEGETLWLNYARTEDDYWQYHGHEYPWIGWEELTNHAVPTVYLKMMSCNRSSNKNIPRKYRATCNPSGPGHQWVKHRFIDMVKAGKIYRDEFEQTRAHIKSSLTENTVLLDADPMYMEKLMAMTQDDQLLRDAWVYGSWELVTGGFFTDVWNNDIHILPNFPIPTSWKLYRSFDWGSSRPWAVTYGFEANGEQPEDPFIPYIPPGSVIIAQEVYGWNGVVNEGDRATSQEIAERTLEVDSALLTEYGVKCYPGPADTSIWEVRDGSSIAGNLSTHGCRWTKAYKGSGSRIAGWALIRQMLGAAKRGDLENPHLYFLNQAQHHIRTLPLMQRDKRKPEDIDTNLEDHLMDSLRYLLARKMTRITRHKVGM